MWCFPRFFFGPLLCCLLAAAHDEGWQGEAYRPYGAYPPRGGMQNSKQGEVFKLIMADVINRLGVKLLAIQNEYNENNIAISPYGALSVLVALGEGLQGDAVREIQLAAHIPNDISIIRQGLRDINRQLQSYFIPKEGFLAGLTLNYDSVTLKPQYQDILLYYGYDLTAFNVALYPPPRKMGAPEPTGTVGTTTAAVPSTTPVDAGTTTSSEASTGATNSGLATVVPITSDTTGTMAPLAVPSTTTTSSEHASTSSESVSTIQPFTNSLLSSISDSTTLLTPDVTPAYSTTELPSNVPTTEEVVQSTTDSVSDKITETGTITTTQQGKEVEEATEQQIVTTEASTKEPEIATAEGLTTEQQILTTNALTAATTEQQILTTNALIAATTKQQILTTNALTAATTEQQILTTNTLTATSTEQQIMTTEAVTTEPEIVTAEALTTEQQNLTTNALTAATTEQQQLTTEALTAATTEQEQLTTEALTAVTTEQLPTTVTDSIGFAGSPKQKRMSVSLNKWSWSDQKYTRRRVAKSVDDYVTYQGHFDDTSYNYPKPIDPVTGQEPSYFLAQGRYKDYNVNFMRYNTALPVCDVAHLDARALKFPLDRKEYYLLILLPNRHNGVDKLVRDLRFLGDLRQIVDCLRLKHVDVTIPSFKMNGYVKLTNLFQRLGIRRVFEPNQADFTPMTDQNQIYVTNIEQAITVDIKHYVDIENMNRKNSYPWEFKADHPFLFFVLDAELQVTLMSGKITNPLNTRIS